MVREANRRGIEQSRIDFMEEFFTLESIFDPLCAGIHIGGGARDHGSGAENRGDIVEQGARAFDAHGARIVH